MPIVTDGTLTYWYQIDRSLCIFTIVHKRFLPVSHPEPVSLPRPRVIPAILRRRLSLYPCVLNRHTVPNAMLQHRNPVQLAHLAALCLARTQFQPFFCGQSVSINEAKCFAGVGHAPVLLFELELVLFALLVLVELPGAVDGPVAEGAVAGAGC